MVELRLSKAGAELENGEAEYQEGLESFENEREGS